MIEVKLLSKTWEKPVLEINGIKTKVPSAWVNYSDEQKAAVYRTVAQLKDLRGGKNSTIIEVRVVRVYPRRVNGKYAGWRVDYGYSIT